MAKAYSRGTPDAYYESYGGGIWVEWKYHDKPVRGTTTFVPSDLCSKLQKRWLERAFYNSIRVFLAVGVTPSTGIVLSSPREWNMTHDRVMVGKYELTKLQIAEYFLELIQPEGEESATEAAQE